MHGLTITTLVAVLAGSPLTKSHDLFTKAFEVALKHGGETKEAREAARAVLHKATRDPEFLRLVGVRACERASMHSRGHSPDDSRQFFGAQAVGVSAVQEIAAMRTRKARRALVAALDLCLCQHYPDLVKLAIVDHGPGLLPYLEERKKHTFMPTRPGELRRCSSDGVDFYIQLLKNPVQDADPPESTSKPLPEPNQKP